ncbi:pyridoxamine 5'-phosphate oxidase family protein [Thermodesulfobacteriota bacterium]
MDFQECINIAKESRVCHLATNDAGHPRVRPLGMLHADDTGFYFMSHATKDMVKQLKIDNRVEVSFLAPGQEGRPGPNLRLTGKVDFIEDLEEKRRLLKDREEMIKRMYGVASVDDPVVTVFRIYTGEGYSWSPEYNLKKSEVERVRF